jgi:YaiO family outer membrane protein
VPRAQALAYAGKLEEAQRLLVPWLDGHPRDEDARFLLARVLAWQARHEDALAQYDYLLSSAPANADYQLGKARALVALGRVDEGLAWARKARVAAPGYAEVWQLELQALEAQGRKREAARLRLEAAKRFPGAAWLEAAGPKRTPPWRVDGLLGFDYLSNGYAPWTNLEVLVTRDWGKHQAAVLGVRDAGRFGLHDQEVQLAYYHPLTSRLTLNAGGSLSPGHQVLPFWALAAGAYYQLNDGWGVAGDLRQTTYTAANTTREMIVVDKYLGAWRGAATFSLTELPTAGVAPGGALTVEYEYGNASREGLTVNLGREMEFIAPGVLQTSDVYGVALVGKTWVGPRWGLTHVLGVQQQGTAYTRAGAQVGAFYAF